MLLSKLKLAIAVVMVMAVLGATGLVYRASGQPAPAQKQPLSEVERLRHENELLKLNLQVVLEKVRAQEAELRTLRTEAKKPAEDDKAIRKTATDALLELVQKEQNLNEARRLKLMEDVKLARQNALRRALNQRTDPLQEAEDALKALRDARDTESQRKAADKLDKALKSLREQSKKEPNPGTP